jgi:guanosine-3',5'-bis(diphosphate) 3'-pyrophosphohydrolase
MDDILNTVYQFAENAHAGQQRKYTPDPYIVHPVRVMETCRVHEHDMPVLAAALLHDVIEDTAVGPEALSEFLHSAMSRHDASRTFRIVIELTDVYVKQAYPHFNRRRRKDMELERLSEISADAQTVKYADILDNVKEITSSDPGFAPRYLKECRAILKKLDKGNPNLRDEALEAVQTRIASL